MSEHPLPPQAGENIHFAAAPVPLTVDYAQRRVVMYYVTESELNDLAKSGVSFNWALFGLCAGGFLSFICVLLSTDIANPKKFASFVAITLVLLVLSIFFAVNCYLESKQVKGTLARVKSNEQRNR